MLQNLGLAKAEAEGIMGGAGWQGWQLVNLPFREEYPGGRQWNLDAAQFKYKPAELADDEAPCHPHWDMICDHIGTELTPALQGLALGTAGRDQDGGRLPAGVGRLRLPLPVRADALPVPLRQRELRQVHLLRGPATARDQGRRQGRPGPDGNDDFNGELAGAIICAVEEMDISKCPGAHARIKEWVTGRTISIRKMRQDSYEQPNTTHWVQTANEQETARCSPATPASP